MSHSLHTPIGEQVSAINTSCGCTEASSDFIDYQREHPPLPLDLRAYFLKDDPAKLEKADIHSRSIPLIRLWVDTVYKPQMAVRENAMKILLIADGAGTRLPALQTEDVRENIQDAEIAIRQVTRNRMNALFTKIFATFSKEERALHGSLNRGPDNWFRTISGAADEACAILCQLLALQARGATKNALVFPDTFAERVDSTYRVMESIMSFNIGPQKVVDGLTAAGFDIFTMEKKDGKEPSIVLRKNIETFLHAVGERWLSRSHEHAIDDIGIFADMTDLLQTTVFPEEADDSTAMNQFYEVYWSVFLEQFDDQESVSLFHQIEMNRSLRHYLSDQCRKKECPSGLRKMYVVANALKQIFENEVIVDQRKTYGCPLLYSGKAKTWYEQHTQPMKDWYKMAFEMQD